MYIIHAYVQIKTCNINIFIEKKIYIMSIKNNTKYIQSNINIYI